MHVHLEGEAWNAMLSPEDQLATRDVPFEKFLFPCVATGVRFRSSNRSVYRILSWGVSSTYVPPKEWLLPEPKLMNDIR